MAVQIPGPEQDWLPLGDQVLTAAASTALTIPSATSVYTGVKLAGVQFVSILRVQTQAYTLRFDGTTAIAGVTNGYVMNPGDFMILYGRKSLDNVRLIQNASGGSVFVSHYIFRPGPGAGI